MKKIYHQTIFIITQTKIKAFLPEELYEQYFEFFMLSGDKELKTFKSMEIEQYSDDFEMKKLTTFFHLLYGLKNVSVLLDGK